MNARIFHPGESINHLTHPDILFQIMSKLDVEHIFLLWFAAKYSSRWKNPDTIFDVLASHSFWQANAKHYLQKNQLTGVRKFHKLMLNRHNAHSIIENKLDRSDYYKRSFFYFLNQKYSELPGVNGLARFLIEDDAEGLFHQLMAAPDLLPLIKKDEYDAMAIAASLGVNRLSENHLRFSGLFTSMMKLRAVNCFDLFVRTFLILYSSLPAYEYDISKNYRPLSIIKIFEKDQYFLKHYLKLSIKLSSNRATPSQSIKHALDNKYFDLLKETFTSLPKERLDYILENCEQWRFPIPKATLMIYCPESAPDRTIFIKQ